MASQKVRAFSQAGTPMDIGSATGIIVKEREGSQNWIVEEFEALKSLVCPRFFCGPRC